MTATAVAGLVVLAGCGSAGSNSSAVDVATPPTLSAQAVAYLPSSVKLLTPHGLAREAQAPALTGELTQWGFEGGSDRYFQGESRKLQVVDSRTLRFRGATGAGAFVAFLRTHLAPYLGGFPKVTPFISRGRTGIIATAAECQCHLANPALLAVVAGGGTVTWLEINGPGATQRALVSLISRAP